MKTDSIGLLESSPNCRGCPLRRSAASSGNRSHPRYSAKNASNLTRALQNLKGHLQFDIDPADQMVDYNSPLSVREYEILYLSAKGLTNQAISDMLSISRHTVKSHFDSIFNKLGVHNRTMAVVWAVRQGFF